MSPADSNGDNDSRRGHAVTRKRLLHIKDDEDLITCVQSTLANIDHVPTLQQGRKLLNVNVYDLILLTAAPHNDNEGVFKAIITEIPVQMKARVFM